MWLTGAWAVATAVPPPWPGRDRLINRHKPPRDADGAEPLPEAAMRDAPEPLPHGCQPFGADAERAEELLVPSRLGAAAIELGVYVPAELCAYDPAQLPVPTRLSPLAATCLTASPESWMPHSRHAVTGVQACQRMVAAAAEATASAPRVNTIRLR